MTLTDPPTPAEREAAMRRLAQVARRGRRRRRRARILAAGGAAGLVALAVVTALVITKRPGGSTVSVASPTTPSAASTSTTSPSSTTLSPRSAAAGFDRFAASTAGRLQTLARRAGVTWDGYRIAPPVVDRSGYVAVAAYSWEPDGKPLRVYRSRPNGHWDDVAALAPPQCPCRSADAAAHWLVQGSGMLITTADITGDGRPDFLIPLNAADNIPGAVLSDDTDAVVDPWHYVSFTGPFPTSKFVGRNPHVVGGRLVSTFNRCLPDCAHGTEETVTWTYERPAGVFWAPDPPGWTAPPGATNHDSAAGASTSGSG